MSEIDSITDLGLRVTKPSSLDEDFLARLTACADGSNLELSSVELEFEKSLRKAAPCALSPALLSSIQSAIGDTPFHTNEKIVRFNRPKETTHRENGRPWWGSRVQVAAAAAVALLGVVSALMIPNNGQSGDQQTASAFPSTTVISSPVANSNNRREIAPVVYNRNLNHASDEGVVWENNVRPHRVMRFSFLDRYTLTNPQGDTLEMERPRDEYVIIPEKVD